MTSSDFDLQTAILERIRLDRRFEPSGIAVAVRDAVATLSGEVDSLSKRSALSRLASQVPGIAALANDIVVRIPGDQRRTDADIAHDVVDALIWDTDVPEKTVTARVHDQWVWLVGECDWNHQRDAAQRAIENVPGVKGVANTIRVKNSLPAGTQVESAS